MELEHIIESFSFFLGLAVLCTLLFRDKKKIRSIATLSKVNNKKLFWLWQKVWLVALLISIAVTVLTVLTWYVLECLLLDQDQTLSLSCFLIWLNPLLHIIIGILILPTALLGLLVNAVLYYVLPAQYISWLKEDTKARTIPYRLVEALCVLSPLMLHVLFFLMLYRFLGLIALGAR